MIVTEADRPAAAPERSVRPQRRPDRAVEVAAAEAEDAPEPEPTAPADDAPEAEAPAAPAREDRQAAIEDVLAGLVSEDVPSAATPAAPGGPPLTEGERDGFRLAVQDCWNVGTLSMEALQTVVTVAFELTRDGFPRTDTIQLLGSTGSGVAEQVAFEAARSAIINCSRRTGGYQLPEEKYEQWREVELTFDPTQMRLR